MRVFTFKEMLSITVFHVASEPTTYERSILAGPLGPRLDFFARQILAELCVEAGVETYFETAGGGTNVRATFSLHMDGVGL